MTNEPHTPPEDIRDRGSVLPLVLVVMIIGSLVVLPMLQYSATVFRANRVVSERAQDVEAAKAGLRVALSDTANLFVECDDGGTLPSVVVNGTNVSTSCSEISEVGVAEALGGRVPYHVVATQIGQSIPDDFAFGIDQDLTYGPAAPPYPDTPPVECPSVPSEFWWCGDIDVNTDTDVDEGAPTPVSDSVWLPDLPEWPAVERTTDYAMPAGFNCRVYLPGRYAAPVTIDAGNVYFASGVYYFEEPVTIEGTANVVVGYGLEDFSTGCADDRQVSVNLENPPSIYGISGAGATWVFGKNGRLVVDDSTGSPSIKFNQRYVADGEAGGRLSIMTVNGHVDGINDHTVTHVNHVPRSRVLDGISSEPIAAGTYEPSAIEYTDIAREPERVNGFDVDTYTDPITGLGIAQLEWDDLAGNEFGGSLLGVREADGTWSQTPYEVRMRVQSPVQGSWQSICLPDDIVIESQGSGLPDRLLCTVDGLDPASEHRFQVRPQSTDAYGNVLRPTSGNGFRARTLPIDSTFASAPDAPTIVSIEATDTVNEAVVTWLAPTSDIVVDDYEVTVTAITQETPTDEGPRAFDASTSLDAGDVGIVQLPVSEPNGTVLNISVDDSSLRSLDPTASVVVNGTTAEITTSVLTPGNTYALPYTIDDGVTPATATLSVTVVPSTTASLTTYPGGLVSLTLPSVPGVPTVTVDDTPVTGVDPAVTVTESGLDVAIQTTTVTPVGVYDLPYTVTDGATTLNGIVRLTVDTNATVPPKEIQTVKVVPSSPPAGATPPYSVLAVVEGPGLLLDPAPPTTFVGDIVTVYTSPFVADGVYDFTASMVDSLGLPAGTASASFTIDSTPTTTVASPPAAYDARALAEVGVPITIHAPVSDPDRDALSIAITDAAPLTSVDASASVSVSGLDVTVTTVAVDGTYPLTYTVTDSLGQTASGIIEVVVDRTVTAAGSCRPPREDLVPLHLSCAVSSLTPITPVTGGGLGYRFDVVAISKAGTSAASSNAMPYPTQFSGGSSPFVGPLPLERIVVPYLPEPVIDIRASASGTATVAIAGYVSAPMGRISIDNPSGESIKLVGGLLAGTFDVVDGRADGTRNSVPVGYFNDIVLQRTVRVTSVADKRRSVAVVQVNEDGGAAGITSWFVE